METKDFSDCRFLIVDDEIFMMGLLERALRKLGVSDIVKASDGAAALELLRNGTHSDCIISDMDMKPMNGLQLLQTVRTGEIPTVPRDQPFIILTGNDNPEVAVTALKLDVNAFLAKPPKPEELRDALNKVFSDSILLKEVLHYRRVAI